MRIDSRSESFTVPSQLLGGLYSEDGRRIVAFIGSGLSVAAGLPTWEELIRRVAGRLGVSEEVAPALADGRLLDACEFLSIRFGEAGVRKVVADVIRAATPAESRPHTLLNQIPFHGIITTNYDVLCTSAPGGERWGFPLHHGVTGPNGRARQPFVFHLHGHVDDEQSIVFTKGAYDRFADGSDLPGGKFLLEALQSACVVFLGFGFRDANVERVLRHLRRAGLELTGDAFAVLPVEIGEKSDPVRNALLERSGVRPIEVEGKDLTAAADWWLSNLEALMRRGTGARAGSVTRLEYAAQIVAELDRLLACERDRVRAEISGVCGRADLEQLFFADGESVALSRIWEFVSAGEARELLSRAAERSHDPGYQLALTLLPSSV